MEPQAPTPPVWCVQSVRVQWRVVAGAGTLIGFRQSDQSTATDNLGRSQVDFLATSVGKMQVEASVPGLVGSPLLFWIDVEQPPDVVIGFGPMFDCYFTPINNDPSVFAGPSGRSDVSVIVGAAVEFTGEVTDQANHCREWPIDDRSGTADPGRESRVDGGPSRHVRRGWQESNCTLFVPQHGARLGYQNLRSRLRQIRLMPVSRDHGTPYTTIWLAADPPGQIGDFIPVATPINCRPATA
jgi:hypothetical protein